MSQFQSDDFKQTRDVQIRSDLPTIGKGKGALFVSMLFFVPLAPFTGMVMALAARRSNARTSAYGGGVSSGLAVMLGLALTAGQALVGYRGYEHFTQLTTAPGHALTAGFCDNQAGFTGAFASTPADGGAQAALFIDALRSRYGEFIEARLEGSPVDGGFKGIDGPHVYELVFENGTVQAQAGYAFDPEIGAEWLTSRLEYIAVRDTQHGNLVFPATGVRMLTQQPTDH